MGKGREIERAMKIVKYSIIKQELPYELPLARPRRKIGARMQSSNVSVLQRSVSSCFGGQDLTSDY